MPPVMGAAAFVMASFIGVTYFEVVKHAFLPAVISYIALFYISHLEALKLGLKGMDDADVLAVLEVLSEAIEAVFAGKVTESRLNRLVLRAHLSWSEVDIMRTFIGFARQIGLRQTQSKVRDILLLRPMLAKRFVDCFHARFDPDFTGDRAAVWTVAKSAYEDARSEVTTLDEDRVFRALFNLLEASLRTNYYRTDRVQPYISVKIDHDLMRDLPAPKLKYEIYVYPVSYTHLTLPTKA